MSEEKVKIDIEPIGYVTAEYDEPANMPLHGKPAVIEILPEYSEALTLIEKNSHLWVLSWFHKSDRSVLKTAPMKIDPNMPQYGVFALRAPNRPNPIGLSLVELDRVEGNKLYVKKFDGVNGTPIIDIKPYFQKDIVFSPDTPDIHPIKIEAKRTWMLEEAIRHHKEMCPDLVLAVRMAALADVNIGKLSHDDVLLYVEGSSCLIDTLQGLARARIANPPRLSFDIVDNKGVWKSVWTKGDQKTVTISCNMADLRSKSIDEIGAMTDEDLFQIVIE